MDLRPGKGFTSQQSDEHQRRWSDARWRKALDDGNYDRSREHLNFEVTRGGVVRPIDTSESIPKRIKRRLAELGIKDPNQGKQPPTRRTVCNIIFGGSRERMLELAFGDQPVNIAHGATNPGLHRRPEIELWAQDMYRFACEQFGEDNVMGFYVHLDEKNPHAHCTVLPINSTGRLSYNDVIAGNTKWEYRDRMLSLHSRLAEVNRRWGLTRGESVNVTGAKHRSTEEYRRDLTRQNSELERRIAEHSFTLSELMSQIRLAQRRVKGLNTMIENLTNRHGELEREIARLTASMATAGADQAALVAALEQKRQELSRVETAIADKRGKLDVAIGMQQKLAEENARAQAYLVDTRQRIADSTRGLTAVTRMRLAQAGFETVMEEFAKLLPSFTDPKDRALFDGSFLNDFAARGNDIMVCAAFLFTGYIDQATQFAEGHGGGTTSDLPWGRKEDEDECAWARRCLLMAHKMMKPSASRGLKKK